MGMNHKMINLCDASFIAATRMNNFSGWVRTKVLQHATGSQETAISEAPSRQLLAVVMARVQQAHGFDHEMCDAILSQMSSTDLV